MASSPTRRALLVGAVCLPSLWAAGCTGAGPREAPAERSTAPADPLLALWQARVELVVVCDQMLAPAPAPAPAPASTEAVAVIRAQTVEQIRALADALGSAPQPRVGTAPSAGGVPTDPGEATARLRRLIDTAGAACGTLCLTVAADRAPLLGSLAAAARCHGELLT